MSWGAFLVAVIGLTALVLILLGFAMFVSDEILDADDPEDRWARDEEDAA